MKKIFLLTLFFLQILRGVTTAQNPYESIGKTTEVLTLSNGKYQEFFPNDTIVRIGSVLFNRLTNEVVAFLTEKDSSSLVEADVASRFLSVDPIGRKFPELTPYQFGSNRPIDGVDLDGLEWAMSTESVQDGTQIKVVAVVEVKLNFSSTINSLPPTVFQTYLDAASAQFDRTLSISSDGAYKGRLTFSTEKINDDKRVVPSAIIDDNVGGGNTIAGISGYENAQANLYKKSGVLKTPQEFAIDFIHEVFHTIMLEHPVEWTQGIELTLIQDPTTKFKSTYKTTDKTDKNILFNIMMYDWFVVDGKIAKEEGKPLEYLTKSQIELLEKEVSRQTKGEGSKADPKREDYWLIQRGKKTLRDFETTETKH